MKRALTVLILATAMIAVPEAALAAPNPAVSSLQTASNPDWMRSIPDSRSLAALSIPGTHETMAVQGGGLTQTQESLGTSGGALAAQLKAGIRMIDIRARVNDGNTFTIHHGSVYQNANFDDVLNKIREFLTAHPGETVLIRLKQECTGEFGSCTDASGQSSFPDIFDGYVARNTDLFWAPSVNRNSAVAVPTLGEVRGKIVLAVMNGAHGGRWPSYGLDQFSGWNDGNSTYVQDNYTVPLGGIGTKENQVTAHLTSTNTGNQTAIYVNFTSGSSILMWPQSVANSVNPFLLTYLNGGHGVSRTGAIMMDFPGGGLIDKIISYNR